MLTVIGARNGAGGLIGGRLWHCRPHAVATSIELTARLRKMQRRWHSGVRAVFSAATQKGTHLYLSVVKIGDLRTGVERLRHRGDVPQGKRLERGLGQLITAYAQATLPIAVEIAQVSGHLRVPRRRLDRDPILARIRISGPLDAVIRGIGPATRHAGQGPARVRSGSLVS